MKRAKIMLIAIAVLATVGGSLAFKASKFGLTKYCTTTLANQPCRDFKLIKPATGAAAFTVYYTTTILDNCDTEPTCESKVKTSFTTIE